MLGEISSTARRPSRPVASGRPRSSRTQSMSPGSMSPASARLWARDSSTSDPASSSSSRTRKASPSSSSTSSTRTGSGASLPGRCTSPASSPDVVIRAPPPRRTSCPRRTPRRPRSPGRPRTTRPCRHRRRARQVRHPSGRASCSTRRSPRPVADSTWNRFMRGGPGRVVGHLDARGVPHGPAPATRTSLRPCSTALVTTSDTSRTTVSTSQPLSSSRSRTNRRASRTLSVVGGSRSSLTAAPRTGSARGPTGRGDSRGTGYPVPRPEGLRSRGLRRAPSWRPRCAPGARPGPAAAPRPASGPSRRAGPAATRCRPDRSASSG